MRIGVMQGRLLPPVEGRHQSFPSKQWREEFPLAVEAGLDMIEWIYDAISASENPLATDSGVTEMRHLSEKYNVAVVSLCADYFMAYPLAKAVAAEQEQRIQKLLWLLDRCKFVGIRRVVLPFLDNSKIESDAEEAKVVQILRRALAHAENRGIELDFETSLDPQRLRMLLTKLPQLKVNYDSGNSASLGYDVREEMSAYIDRIGGVHIKDRIRGAGTVPLGSGNADIPTLLSHLNKIGYTGDFVMEAARGEAGKELAWVRNNRHFLLNELQAASFPLAA
jgi:L-ribulose-5-phosphate 3-epimerase